MATFDEQKLFIQKFCSLKAIWSDSNDQAYDHLSFLIKLL